ncbi:MAG: hypothetical protein JWN18_418 [Parcubacteria group bacterium]|nr:hypothetical protein [Parcubacteria group bacterium]
MKKVLPCLIIVLIGSVISVVFENRSGMMNALQTAGIQWTTSVVFAIGAGTGMFAYRLLRKATLESMSMLWQRLFKGVLLVGLCSLFIFAADYEHKRRESKSVEHLSYHKYYKAGDLVEMRTDGRRGVVLEVSGCLSTHMDSHRSCNYSVRFPSSAVRTNTHLLDPDGPIRAVPYEVLIVYDYELTRAQT